MSLGDVGDEEESFLLAPAAAAGAMGGGAMGRGAIGATRRPITVVGSIVEVAVCAWGGKVPVVGGGRMGINWESGVGGRGGGVLIGVLLLVALVVALMVVNAGTRGEGDEAVGRAID